MAIFTSDDKQPNGLGQKPGSCDYHRTRDKNKGRDRYRLPLAH